MIRVGYGYDVHRTAAGRRLMLGGVVIPWDRGLLGHSDADVLLHAITDAVLGALAAGDIGQWFPPDDERYRDADSAELLRTVLRAPCCAGWRLGNVDATVVAERPRLLPYVPAMRRAIAALFEAGEDQVSVKATTSEGLGFACRGEGMTAAAVVLLVREGR